MKTACFAFLSVICVLLFENYSFAQSFKYGQNWIEIGPTETPKNEKFRGDAGVGPVEFIRIHQKHPNHLLAGSLSGGLFYSKDAGENWINAGSDFWDYSGCPWADFYPQDTTVWFACSNQVDNNGKPGKIRKKGGLFRTNNGGKKWVRIGSHRDFGGNGNAVIYGTRFHPNQPDFLFVLTSEGLYYTENCMSEFVKWAKVPLMDGWMYDMDFLNGSVYVSNFYHNHWNVYATKLDEYGKFQKLKAIALEQRPMRNLTFEPYEDKLLVAMDFKSGTDEVFTYDPETDSLTLLLKKQNISFGSGHTFAVSPHNNDELLFGQGTRVKKWSISKRKKTSFSTKYHVDVEFVAYDPIDTNTIYFATHGGVFKTTDKAEKWENKSRGLGVTEVLGMAVSGENSDQIAIGCFHDGSMGYADYNKNGEPFWRTINGGDGLLPLLHPDSANIVYTSNQYGSGGFYYSNDTSRTIINLHSKNGLKTAGWEMAAFLNPANPENVFF